MKPCTCAPDTDHTLLADMLGDDALVYLAALDNRHTSDTYDEIARLACITAKRSAHSALHVWHDLWDARDLSEAIIVIQTHYSAYTLELADEGFMALVHAANHLDARLERVLTS